MFYLHYINHDTTDSIQEIESIQFGTVQIRPWALLTIYVQFQEG